MPECFRAAPPRPQTISFSQMTVTPVIRREEFDMLLSCRDIFFYRLGPFVWLLGGEIDCIQLYYYGSCQNDGCRYAADGRNCSRGCVVFGRAVKMSSLVGKMLLNCSHSCRLRKRQSCLSCLNSEHVTPAFTSNAQCSKCYCSHLNRETKKVKNIQILSLIPTSFCR